MRRQIGNCISPWHFPWTFAALQNTFPGFLTLSWHSAHYPYLYTFAGQTDDDLNLPAYTFPGQTDDDLNLPAYTFLDSRPCIFWRAQRWLHDPSHTAPSVRKPFRNTGDLMF